MEPVTVYGLQPSPYVRTVLLALVRKGVPYELVPPDLGSEAHRALHPFGKMPAFQHGGLTLFESHAIARYVDAAFEGPALQPADAAERAVQDAWMSAAQHYLAENVAAGLVAHRVVFPRIGRPSDEARVERARPFAERDLDAVAGRLAGGGPFVMGEALTLADLALAPVISDLRIFELGRELLAARPGLEPWLERIEGEPGFGLLVSEFAAAEAA